MAHPHNELSFANEDVAQSRQAMEKLDVELRRLSGIVESSVDAIISKDLNGVIITWNQGAQNLFGYAAEEVIGKPVTILIPEDHVNEEPEILGRIRRGDRVDHYETVRKRKDGTLIDISLTVSPVRDNTGRIIGASKIARDITQRKQTERALADLRRNLESRVEERTRELQKAKEIIEKSLEDKEVLLKEIHHRVKNNLQIISSLLRMQLQHMNDSEAANVLRECQSRINSMALIHRQLYQSTSFSLVKVKEYVESLVAQLFSAYRDRSSQIQYEVEVDDISIDIDTAIPCGLILTELMTNTLKYAFPANSQGKVSVSFKANEEGQCLLSVQDNGVGLPSQFDIQQPTSLGFQIVKALSNQLGAQIENQKTSVGASVRVTFPYPTKATPVSVK